LAYSHFTLVADGEVVSANPDSDTQPGPAICTMKVWADTADTAADMLVSIAPQLGFQPAGEMEVYETEPVLPAEDRPFAYQVTFTAYCDDADDETLN
jgi:hypothetical protein